MMCPDWSLLPADILSKICELHSLPFRIVLRSVCKSWCQSIPPLCIPSPWLLFPGDGPDFGEFTTTFRFFSPLGNTFFDHPVPPDISALSPAARQMHCVGSQGGWLIMSCLYFSVWLVNPLTGARIVLHPFCNSSEFVFRYDAGADGSVLFGAFRDLRIANGEEAGRSRSFERRELYVRKVVLCGLPGEKDFATVALFAAGSLAFLKGNKKDWHGVKRDMEDVVFEDIAYVFGAFWGLTKNGDIAHIRFPKEGLYLYSLVKMPYDPAFDVHKFIALDGGCNVYMILRNGESKLHPDGKHKFHTRDLAIFKHSLKGSYLDEDPSWVPVAHLDGKCLFIGNNECVTFSAKDSPQLRGRGNCVFITSVYGKDETFDMGIYDMINKTFQHIFPPDKEELNWTQPPPIWFRPCMMGNVSSSFAW